MNIAKFLVVITASLHASILAGVFIPFIIVAARYMTVVVEWPSGCP
jgi:hypothetical protein